MQQFPLFLPPDFDLEHARELAYLVEQAYQEFAAGPNAQWQLAPAPMQQLAGAYTDIVPFTGTIRLQPRLWKVLVRHLRVPAWLLPHKTITESFGFIARRGTNIYLVFRGTKTRADWWEDLHMEQLPVPTGMLPKRSGVDWRGAAVESGVLTLYLTLRDTILRGIQQYAPPQRLSVTGHSLGACLAMLAVPDLIANTAFNGDWKPVVYNFGQPRFVNREFARAFVTEGCQAFRVVHTEDIVPALMPSVPVLWFANARHHLFYAHTGVPIDFTKTYSEATPDREHLLLANHAMETYQAALWTSGLPAIARVDDSARATAGVRPAVTRDSPGPSSPIAT
jgi:Lipase (class 3)